MERLAEQEINDAVRAALAEDVGSGDVTTRALVPEGARARAMMVAREPLVVAGLALAEATFRAQSPAFTLERVVEDGQAVAAAAVVLRITGPAQALLTAERVALNYVQRLSGIATLTAQYVAAIRGTRAQILDTRKTTPGWRRFEKYAVACGGGRNHRMGLFDLVLIKDNHLAILRGESPHPVMTAVRRARERYPALPVEVEADTVALAVQAAEAGADMILLDNMPVEELRRAVQAVGGRARLEASGGVNLEIVRAIAETGVDYISVGALTHSARAMDLALDVVEL